MTTKDILDKDGVRLPIKIDSTSNGEYEPIPISKKRRKQTCLEWATENAKSKGQTRREFLISSRWAASTLLAINHANAYYGSTGGFFDVTTEML